MSREIRIHVERLVLDPSFAHLDPEAVGAAVQTELSRLLGEGGVPLGLDDGGRRGRVDGGRFDVAPGAGAETVGRQVARNVYRGIGR
jgi:hypothetical protein